MNLETHPHLKQEILIYSLPFCEGKQRWGKWKATSLNINLNPTDTSTNLILGGRDHDLFT